MENIVHGTPLSSTRSVERDSLVDLLMLPYSTTLLPSQFGFLETTKYNNEKS